MVGREAGAGAPLLHATMQAAIARRPRTLVVTRPWKWNVSPFTANASDSFEYSAIDDTSSTHAGPENHAEDDVRSSRRTIAPFREGEAVGIIGHVDRAPDAAFDVRLQGIPLRQVELQFFINPDRREIVPGVPMPTGASEWPEHARSSSTIVPIASTVAA